jgi:hypothetical protein
MSRTIKGAVGHKLCACLILAIDFVFRVGLKGKLVHSIPINTLDNVDLALSLYICIS